MADYARLEDLAGIELGNGVRVEASVLGKLLAAYPRGVPQPSPVLWGPDDVHIIPGGPHKGRVQLFPGESWLDLMHLYRVGKYVDPAFLDQLIFPEDDARGKWCRKRIVEYRDNIKEYGNDAYAHLCRVTPSPQKYPTISQFADSLQLPPRGEVIELHGPPSERPKSVRHRLYDPCTNEDIYEHLMSQQNEARPSGHAMLRWLSDRRMLDEWRGLPE